MHVLLVPLEYTTQRTIFAVDSMHAMSAQREPGNRWMPKMVRSGEVKWNAIFERTLLHATGLGTTLFG